MMLAADERMSNNAHRWDMDTLFLMSTVFFNKITENNISSRRLGEFHYFWIKSRSEINLSWVVENILPHIRKFTGNETKKSILTL